MPGFIKNHPKRTFGSTFPASRYDNPQGSRATALERNVLRYRAIEATLYLFYAEDVRGFMLSNVYPHALKEFRDRTQQLPKESRQGKKLEIAFVYAIKIGIFTDSEVREVKELLDYRNDIAHRIHLVMSDITRSYSVTDYLSFTAPTYKGDALDRLRIYQKSLWKRAHKHIIWKIAMDNTIFDFAKRTYEKDLVRLDRLIKVQIEREIARAKAINIELDLSETELVGDLHPRFPENQRPSRSNYGDDYTSPTGHLSKRGAEICFRLYDLGRSPIAVAYLMGITLRSAERRYHGWLKAGGLRRSRVEVDRYDPQTLDILPIKG